MRLVDSWTFDRDALDVDDSGERAVTCRLDHTRRQHQHPRRRAAAEIDSFCAAPLLYNITRQLHV